MFLVSDVINKLLVYTTDLTGQSLSNHCANILLGLMVLNTILYLKTTIISMGQEHYVARLDSHTPHTIFKYDDLGLCKVSCT